MCFCMFDVKTENTIKHTTMQIAVTKMQNHCKHTIHEKYGNKKLANQKLQIKLQKKLTL